MPRIVDFRGPRLELIVEVGHALLDPREVKGLAPRDVLLLDRPKRREFGPSFPALVHVRHLAFFARVELRQAGASAVLLHREEPPRQREGIGRIAVELTRVSLSEGEALTLKPRDRVDLGVVDFEHLWLSSNGKLFGRCSLVRVDGQLGAEVHERL